MKPFKETLRVTNPVRQSRASSRKRVLRGAGRPSPRSVDSEIKRCVIEPRNYHRREPSSWTLAGAEPGISYTWTHRRAWSHRGRRNMANDHTGFSGTWETLPSPSCLPAGAPAYQLQVDPQLCPELVETSRGRPMVSPSEGNEARRDGRQGVAVPHSSVEAGERPSRTPWSEGGAALWTGSWNHAEDTVPHQRVTAKPPSRVGDSDSTM